MKTPAWLVSFGLGLIVCATGSAQLINAYDAGKYNDVGASVATNTNYIAGHLNAGANQQTFRNFFAFDLSTITGGIANVSINIFEPSTGFSSIASPLNYQLFDVSTPFATVLAGGLAGVTGVGVYNDLGSGNPYGSTSITSANNSSFITISLNNTFINDFIAHEGTTLIIGGAVINLSGSGQQEVFSGSGTENVGMAVGGLTSGLVTLSYTPVPEPSTYALCGAAVLVGLMARKRQKNSHRAMA